MKQRLALTNTLANEEVKIFSESEKIPADAHATAA